MPTRDHIEFQERSIAKGYLITFRCYGTWLHGDERGSVDRRFYNVYGGRKIAANDETVARKLHMMNSGVFTLGAKERQVVETAIREVCKFRGYGLYALNVRTEHVHATVSNCGEPERIMDSFKAYATRALRADGLLAPDAKAWSRHGSTRYLWTDEHVSAAVGYVNDGQGGELPRFD
jgi:REP element-mobilizing transposase RayT